MTLVQEYESIFKKKVERACLQTGLFLVSDRKVIIWFNLFNQFLFDSTLPRFDQINFLSDVADNHGNCIVMNNGKTILEIYNHFSNKKLFLEILAHEMIHLYDHVHNNGKMNHGKTFFAWKSKMNDLGLRLNVKY